VWYDTYERRMSHVADLNESCHTYECVMSHMSQLCWIDHMCVYVSYDTYEWVMSHVTVVLDRFYGCVCVIWHIWTTNESCRRFEWVMSQLCWIGCMCHMTHMNETYHVTCLSERT